MREGQEGGKGERKKERDIGKKGEEMRGRKRIQRGAERDEKEGSEMREGEARGRERRESGKKGDEIEDSEGEREKEIFFQPQSLF